MTMSSSFFFRQKRILVSVLTVVAIVFAPAPIVAQPISPRLHLYKSPKLGGLLRAEEEFAKNLGWTLGRWARDYFVYPKGDYGSLPRGRQPLAPTDIWLRQLNGEIGREF
jgi:hypothetical protein